MEICDSFQMRARIRSMSRPTAWMSDGTSPMARCDVRIGATTSVRTSIDTFSPRMSSTRIFSSSSESLSNVASLSCFSSVTSAPPTGFSRNSLHDLRDPRRWRMGHARSSGKRGPRRGRRRNARAPSPCRTGRRPNTPRTKRPPSRGPLDEPHGRRLGHARLLHAFDRELEPAGSRRHDALPVLEDLGDKEDALEREEHRLGPEGGLRVVHEPARHIEELLARKLLVHVAGPLEVVRALGHRNSGHTQSGAEHSPSGPSWNDSPW